MARTKEVSEPKVTKSREYVSDSSSDSGSDDVAENGIQRQKSQVSSQSVPKTTTGTQSSSQSESDSSVGSSDSDRSATKKRSDPPVPVREPSRKKSKVHSTKAPLANRNSFQPPTGYSPIELDATDFLSQSGKTFSHLNGKQIWHITAPASVPIAMIEHLDIPAALRGEPILQYKDINYNMFAASSTGETLLLPQGTDSKYSKAKVDISRNFHLRELPPHKANTDTVTDSKADANSNAHGDGDGGEGEHSQFFASQQGVKKPKREQPSGLLMRYQPYGSDSILANPYRLSDPAVNGAVEDGNGSSDMLVVPPGLSDDESHSPVKTPKKSKHGKRSKHEKISQETGVLGDDAMDIDTNLNGASQSTPQPKTKISGSKPESERKKSKHRKEKA